MRHIKHESLNFFDCAGVQAGEDFYVLLFYGVPVSIKKICNLHSEPIIKNLPPMQHDKSIGDFAVACINKSTIVVTGGTMNDDGA